MITNMCMPYWENKSSVYGNSEEKWEKSTTTIAGIDNDIGFVGCLITLYTESAWGYVIMIPLE